MSGASEGANRRASGPVLASLFLFVPDHSAMTPDGRALPPAAPNDRVAEANSGKTKGENWDEIQPMDAAGDEEHEVRVGKR